MKEENLVLREIVNPTVLALVKSLSPTGTPSWARLMKNVKPLWKLTSKYGMRKIFALPLLLRSLKR